jgi:hypothetical protein
MRVSRLTWVGSSVTAFAVAAAVVLLVAAGSASAARPLTVCASGCQFTTLADALAAADDGDRITIGPGVFSGGLAISKSVSLSGAGAADTTISGLHSFTVLTVLPGAAVTVSDLTVSDGEGHGFCGGGILNNGTLRLRNSAVTNNDTVFGGGICNHGTLTLTHSTVTANRADVGAGIDNVDAVLTLDDTTVTGNTAALRAGGILNSGTLAMHGSRIAGNVPSDCEGC